MGKWPTKNNKFNQHPAYKWLWLTGAHWKNFEIMCSWYDKWKVWNLGGGLGKEQENERKWHLNQMQSKTIQLYQKCSIAHHLECWALSRVIYEIGFSCRKCSIQNSSSQSRSFVRSGIHSRSLISSCLCSTHQINVPNYISFDGKVFWRKMFNSGWR